MKAAIISKPGDISVQEMEMPKITNPTQVLVRVKLTGICGSDVHIYKGENPFATYPRVFGHEFTGEVVEIGSGVTTLKPGDHVVGEPIVSCGTCYACRNHRPNVCAKLQVMGVHIEGGCREYVLLEEAKAHKIAADIPWHCAVLTEPMTIGLQATSRGALQAGDMVLIMGSGTIGLCCLLAAKAKGATCIMTDIVPKKLEYAKKMGADYVIDVTKKDLATEVQAITGGMGPNVILDCVCAKWSLEQAVDMVSVAGRVVELGFGPIKSEIPHAVIMKKEVTLAGTRLEAFQFPNAVALVEKNAALLEDFVTQHYGIADVAQAFAFATEHPEKVRKIVVEL